MKRAFDLFFSVLMVILLSPVFLIVAFLILIFLGRPIIFCQSRPGLHGSIFTLYKFRTMKNDKDASGRLLPDSKRLGRFGKFVRATSMDELPELWNIIKGDMSLVGPRPLLLEYLPLFNSRQSKRHDLKPGLTGWAQINGRNNISWEKQLEMDVWYVENHSIFLDAKIIFVTFWKVIRCDGISQDGHVTKEKFRGAKYE